MRIIVMALALALLFTACSASHTDGCWITHTNEVNLNPDVPLPRDGEPLAMNPGDSYRVWCARTINESSMGAIIDEEQQTIKIEAMPQDAELRVYPNERDAVYLGHPVAASGDVWKGLQEASDRRLIYWLEAVALLALIAVVVIAFWGWRQRTQSSKEPDHTFEPF